MIRTALPFDHLPRFVLGLMTRTRSSKLLNFEEATAIFFFQSNRRCIRLASDSKSEWWSMCIEPSHPAKKSPKCSTSLTRRQGLPVPVPRQRNISEGYPLDIPLMRSQSLSCRAVGYFISVGYERCMFYGRSYEILLKTVVDFFIGFKVCPKHILLMCWCDSDVR